jgi:hypothetical protein
MVTKLIVGFSSIDDDIDFELLSVKKKKVDSIDDDIGFELFGFDFSSIGTFTQFSDKIQVLWLDKLDVFPNRLITQKETDFYWNLFQIQLK